MNWDYSWIFNVNTENVIVKKCMHIFRYRYILLQKKKIYCYCFLSLSGKEYNVVYCDMWHHKLEKPSFINLLSSNVDVWGNTDKSVFLSNLNITPYLPFLQTIY